MKNFLQKNHRLVFYGAWLLLGLMQSSLTELMDDEAYYWVYSRFLDWGYFDHPPMIAVLIKMGYAIFHNELGVRLFLLLLNTLSLMIIESLIDKKNPFLFYAIVLSLAALQLSGFVAVPDTPLIFFTALFFLVYKSFLQKSSLLNTVLLALVVAALLYSKYHAVLIVFFVLLSNPKLFLKYQTYIAGLLALAFFIPHLWWQYQHDWISFRYHLFESNVNKYKPSFTLDYIGGQILLAGPLAGVILVPAAFLFKTENQLQRSLKFTLVGIYVFFLLSSFRGKVEGNWTSPVIVPLIILSHQFLLEKINWRKWLLRLLPITMVLVLFARVVMIMDILPVKEIKKRYHSWKEWPQQMKEITKGLPVVFDNSYQRASKYWFYTGQTTYSLNSYKERRNNYNFWPIEDSLLGKPVYQLDIYNLDSFKVAAPSALGLVAFKYHEAWQSFAKVIFAPLQKEYSVHPNENLSIKYNVVMPDYYKNFIAANNTSDASVMVSFFRKDGKWVKDILLPQPFAELTSKTQTISITPQLETGDYYFIFSVYVQGTVITTHNSSKIKLEVK